jgi:cyclopropane fatty-acyl-phospholipid synthase-like methyltransferase
MKIPVWLSKWSVNEGSSNLETQDVIEDWLCQLWPETLLDVGAGAGRYGLTAQELYKCGRLDYPIHTTAVEAWEPYINRNKLSTKYDEVLNIDVRELDNFAYDMVIFGDVLEHMSREDALELWDKVSKQAKHAIIAIPIIHHPQDVGVDGNQYERHVEEDWSVDLVLSSFKNIVSHEAYAVTGAFLAEF